MRAIKVILLLGFMGVGICNVFFFIFWYSVSDFDVVMPAQQGSYTVEALALSVTFLEIILVLVGFLLAALGLFGYTEIKRASVAASKEAAEAEAREEARRVVSEQLEVFRQILDYAQKDGDEHPGSYGLGDQPVDGATPAKDE